MESLTTFYSTKTNDTSSECPSKWLMNNFVTISGAATQPLLYKVYILLESRGGELGEPGEPDSSFFFGK